jgi:hypothetical protein
VNAERAPAQGPPDLLAATILLLALAAPAIATWLAGAIVLRMTRTRPWWLVTLALAGLGTTFLLEGLQGALVRHVWLIEHSFQALGRGQPLAALLIPGLLRMVPLGAPIGMLIAAGAHTPPEPTISRPARRAPAVRARKVERALQHEATRPSDALGYALDGDLWRRGHLLIPPRGHLGLATLLVGMPGAGKSTAIHRLAYLAARECRHLVVIDAKGGHDGLAQDVVANYLAGWPGARVRCFPQEPIDLWRGSPQEIMNRLIEAWDFSLQADYYRQAALLGLRLALAAPDSPVTSTRELVRRMDIGTLGQLWDDFPVEYAEVQGLKAELPGAHLRVSNLAASLGPAFDGSWSYEDCDLAVITIPSLAAPSDADSAIRVLMADYSHFVMTRKPPGQPSLVIVDEFSALSGGRRLAINLLERARGAGAGVILAAQSADALGDPQEQARLEAASAAQILFRTPMPGPISALAGTERGWDGAYRVEKGQVQSATYTERASARVDQDAVRRLPNGHAYVISHGQQVLARIVRTDLDRYQQVQESNAPRPRRLPWRKPRPQLEPPSS